MVSKRTSYSDLRKRIKALEEENVKLKGANEILRGLINGLAIKNQELVTSGEPKKSWWRRKILG